jgi:uncharacterized pyridoxal phosphate-containing UPF0001 family protein
MSVTGQKKNKYINWSIYYHYPGKLQSRKRYNIHRHHTIFKSDFNESVTGQKKNKYINWSIYYHNPGKLQSRKRYNILDVFC